MSYILLGIGLSPQLIGILKMSSFDETSNHKLESLLSKVQNTEKVP